MFVRTVTTTDKPDRNVHVGVTVIQAWPQYLPASRSRWAPSWGRSVFPQPFGAEFYILGQMMPLFPFRTQVVYLSRRFLSQLRPIACCHCCCYALGRYPMFHWCILDQITQVHKHTTQWWSIYEDQSVMIHFALSDMNFSTVNKQWSFTSVFSKYNN